MTYPVAMDPVVAGVVGTGPADAALRAAFTEAERGGRPVRVLAVGPADAEADLLLADRVDRWAEKYPQVPVTVSRRRGVDAAVTLTAATRRAAVLVLGTTPDPAAAAVTVAVRRRARCPVVLVPAG